MNGLCRRLDDNASQLLRLIAVALGHSRLRSLLTGCRRFSNGRTPVQQCSIRSFPTRTNLDGAVGSLEPRHAMTVLGLPDVDECYMFDLFSLM